MIIKTFGEKYEITTTIDITRKVPFWREVKEQMGTVNCIRAITSEFPWMGLMEAKRIADDIQI